MRMPTSTRRTTTADARARRGSSTRTATGFPFPAPEGARTAPPERCSACACWTIIPQIVEPVDKVYINPPRHSLQTFLQDNQAVNPGIGFRPTWSEEERALVANVSTIEHEWGWKAITGQVDIDAEWDDYVQSMMDAGLETLLASLAEQAM